MIASRYIPSCITLLVFPGALPGQVSEMMSGDCRRSRCSDASMAELQARAVTLSVHPREPFSRVAEFLQTVPHGLLDFCSARNSLERSHHSMHVERLNCQSDTYDAFDS